MSAAEPGISPKSITANSGRALAVLIRRNSIWFVLALLLVFFSLQTPYFMTPFNMSNVLFQAALIGFIATVAFARHLESRNRASTDEAARAGGAEAGGNGSE